MLGGARLREFDTMAVSAKQNPNILDEFINQNEYYILKCASKVCHRYITKSDDEWSIALLAFSQAIESYDLNKGSFYSFAELVIKRRLLDYIKSQLKYNTEVSVDPTLFDVPPEEEEDDMAIRLSVAQKVCNENTGDIKLEIDTANQIFSTYNFTFFELSECSPRANKTKKACAQAVNYILSNHLLISEMRNNKLLPIKTIEKNTKVPRKILERHRKYIIAAVEIFTGEFPLIKEYLKYIKEGSIL